MFGDVQATQTPVVEYSVPLQLSQPVLSLLGPWPAGQGVQLVDDESTTFG